ncbi:DUF2510 domain-containing protein [Rathayibacter toxicus]|uniref:DUF2510 domain-containing protein n=1 Tax=Rathayibacter toxicus TaxID=145458 RepID=UPI000695E97D|nr:DUF2510 domain-containing protein [Rathayibacter toxicus]PPG23021.1 DUF2510 domain-containing protein [Rathayibacter toxicus]PPG47603.1 DUF2510 domain-containing protein [Rathayibacter toxicus]PPH64476.1 DUF2510 domain-containing protein [Rathayibacter toxicus]PPH68667.1 DUF2510 domain-containing protein [Rathayibacter toxicus]PPH73523.1 DUF2510 domain-containing protein [Rathayibacter toxicus]
MTDNNQAHPNSGAAAGGEGATPRAGWYPDPAGSPRQRWWDGSGWTESLRDTPSAPPAPSAPGAMPPVPPPAAGPTPPVYAQNAGQPNSYGHTTSGQYPQQPSYPQSGQQPVYQQPFSGGHAEQQRDSSIATMTPWIWVVVLLPLVIALSFFLISPDAFAKVSSANRQYGARPSPGYFAGFVAMDIIWFFATVAVIVFAFLDWRQLKRNGVHKPFHWAWAFLVPPYVYVIGRSVIVKRVTGGGLIPLWTLIGVFVVSTLMFIMWAVAAIVMAPQMHEFNNY